MTLTLIYGLDLDILKMYLHTKMKSLGNDLEKSEPKHGKQDRHTQAGRAVTQCTTMPHSWVVINTFLTFCKL